MSLSRWFTSESFDYVRSGEGTHGNSEVEDFLSSLRAVADDFTVAAVNIDFVQT